MGGLCFSIRRRSVSLGPVMIDTRAMRKCRANRHRKAHGGKRERLQQQLDGIALAHGRKNGLHPQHCQRDSQKAEARSGRPAFKQLDQLIDLTLTRLF